MSEEMIHRLLHGQPSEQQKVGMGIGMNYVKRLIEARYGDRGKLDIKSEMGQGTSIMLTLPVEKGAAL